MALQDHISSNWKKLQKSGSTKNKVSKNTTRKSKDPNTTKEGKVLKVTKVTSYTRERPKKQNTVQLIRDLKNAAKEDATFSEPAIIPSSDLTSEEDHKNGLSINQKQIGKYLAIDCEFVGVGPEGLRSALARVSIVNFYGHTVYDKFVQPQEKVTDWRTWVSGVTAAHMQTAVDFKLAQKAVSDLLTDRILVGHALDHDLEALFLSHPKSMIRDTSKHKPFRELSKGKTPSLKKLAKEILNIDIQGGEHSSVEDARATMMLYKLHKKEFEQKFKPFRTKK
jgi:RNA exonuclease 4